MARQNKLKDFIFGDEPEIKKIRDNVIPNLSLQQIVPNQSQPRRYFDDLQLEELVASIKAYGILEPILVRPLDQESYEIVAGERRYRAAQLVGLTEIPVVIREVTESEARAIALIENLQRQDLNPVEEVEGILELLALHLEKTTEQVKQLLYQMKNEREKSSRDNVIPNEKIEEIFSQLGQNWYSFTCNRLPLLNLPDEILWALRQGKIAYTKAKAIATLKNQEDREQLLSCAIEEKLSLNQIKERITEIKQQTKTEQMPPLEEVKVLSQELSKSKLWQKDPKKWNKIQGLMAKIKSLLKEDN